ncbi:hypothetical protein JTB14_026422 [Gonioctena quinquepunctata]|nr:hypothetical protein JTB14_026422 [Gonioctena quinquepunctata]
MGAPKQRSPHHNGIVSLINECSTSRDKIIKRERTEKFDNVLSGRRNLQTGEFFSTSNDFGVSEIPFGLRLNNRLVNEMWEGIISWDGIL